MYRLFIALNLKPRVIEPIQNICYGVKNARWVPKNQIHLTLRFLGECDSYQFESIQSQLSRVFFQPFHLTLEGVGYFPPRGNPRILWIGIREVSELKRLRGSIDKALERIAIPREQTKYHPHITIARLSACSSPKVIIPFLMENSLFRLPSFFVEEFHLFSSLLCQDGARHHIERTYFFID